MAAVGYAAVQSGHGRVPEVGHPVDRRAGCGHLAEGERTTRPKAVHGTAVDVETRHQATEAHAQHEEEKQSHTYVVSKMSEIICFFKTNCWYNFINGDHKPCTHIKLSRVTMLYNNQLHFPLFDYVNVRQ